MHRRVTLAAAAALVAAVPVALAGALTAVTPNSIAGAKVGLTHAAYKRILGKLMLVEYLENDYSRLVFTRRKVEVYFHGKADAGVVVGTWNPAYRTAEGIGPCSAVKALEVAYTGRLARVLVGGSFAGYRLGALVFALEADSVRAVSLKASTAPNFVAIATAPRSGACPGATLKSTSPPTRLGRWVAFGSGKLAPGVHVVEAARGSCSGGSRVDGRSDAWRCVSQGAVVDPCFAGAAAFVICAFGTPDSRDALRLNLVGGLPAGKANPTGDPTRHDPWALLTANGAYCYRATGTPSRIAGKTISYVCAGAALLGGHPNRARPVWTISLLPGGTSTRYRPIAITAAWW